MKRILVCLILLSFLSLVGVVFAEEQKVMEGATLPAGGQAQAPAVNSPQSGREGVAPTALPVEGATLPATGASPED